MVVVAAVSKPRCGLSGRSQWLSRKVTPQSAVMCSCHVRAEMEKTDKMASCSAPGSRCGKGNRPNGVGLGWPS